MPNEAEGVGCEAEQEIAVAQSCALTSAAMGGGCGTGSSAAIEVKATHANEHPYTSKIVLCEVLNAGHTVLIDAQWFIDQHAREGRFLTRQEMEAHYPEFLITNIQPSEVWEMMFYTSHPGYINMSANGKWLLLAISYPWLGKDHSDPHGVHLAKLARFFDQLVAELQPFGKRIAVFLDVGSLYQDHPIERTAEQKESFDQGLRSVNVWYGHQSVVVVVLSDTIDERSENQMPYHGRGWTTFEWKVSLLASFFVFDLKLISDLSDPMLTHGFKEEGNVLYQLGSLADARVLAEPPTAPEFFDGIINAKVFTNGKDQPFVKRKYKETFEGILGRVERLSFQNVRWSQEEVEIFATQVLPMCPCLKELSFTNVASVTELAISEVLRLCPDMRFFDLDGCHQITDLTADRLAERCPNLWFLSLRDCQVTDSGISHVAEKCRKLQRLSLQSCNITDVVLLKLAETCPELQLLNIAGCRKVTCQGVATVAEKCGRLQTLCIQGCGVRRGELEERFPNVQIY